MPSANERSRILPHVVVHGAGAVATLSRPVQCGRCGHFTPKPVTEPEPGATFSCGRCNAKLGF